MTSTSNRAIEMYVKAGRRKFALKLHGFLAALDIHRGRLASALAIFTSLPAHYAPHMWISLESFMLSRALDIHAELENPQDREWIHILLAYLRTCTNDMSKELASEVNKEKSVTQLVRALRTAAANLDSDLVHTDHPIMAVQVSGDATCSNHLVRQHRLPGLHQAVDDVKVKENVDEDDPRKRRARTLGRLGRGTFGPPLDPLAMQRSTFQPSDMLSVCRFSGLTALFTPNAEMNLHLVKTSD
ncbi:hypothetical protein EV702DRAFT_1283222 [Suillus placidus]|uniref:Uncharacterized protein n=1 Tax=Suillus placidus TaxID=48579 RepID=A0A9P7CVR5_9AGAM|nr:hypothetical protein EV702DRAFT_1283222 [Suillus placidus]